MPRLSDSMEEGTIVRWVRAHGDSVSRGEEIVEIETDKATMSFEAEQDGVLAIVAGVGETVPVGELIARLGSTSASASGPASAARLNASPLARRIAAREGLSLEGLTGSGPRGRVLKADLRAVLGRGPDPVSPAAAAGTNTAPEPVPVPAPVVEQGRGDVTVVTPTRAQEVVARRMVEAKSTIPEFTLTSDIDVSEALALRERIRAAGVDSVPSVNDLVVRACALALRRFPQANGSYRDDRFELYARVNVGIAVATEGSLVVPVVHDADQLSVSALAATTSRLVERARTGAITPGELDAGTFTVSNLGMFGVTSFTAVINPPQAAILAVGAIRRGAERLMTVTLSCDHRILYGADAAQFLAAIREGLEQPLRLLVG